MLLFFVFLACLGIPPSVVAGWRAGNAKSTHTCGHVRGVPSHLRFIDRYYYRKYTEAYGIPIISSQYVSNAALTRACHIVRFLLADRKDMRQGVYKGKGRFGVLAENEGTGTSVPEHRHLGASWNARARGLGATTHIPISTGGEENLMCSPRDRYRGNDIYFHESAHMIGEVALGGWVRNMYAKLKRVYNAARYRGTWRRTYAMTDIREYFAEIMQVYFNNKPEGPNPPNGIHGWINTRSELKRMDPNAYNLIKELYPCGNTYYDCTDSGYNGDATGGRLRMDCDGSTSTKTEKKTNPKKKTGNCEDQNKSCRSWANQGECEKNSAYMKPNCCASCKNRGRTSKKKTKKKKKTSDCKDLNKSCPGWANGGYCETNSAYMEPNCCASCKSKGGTSNCKDKNKSCRSWANQGYCGTNSAWMKPNCCASCKSAGGTSSCKDTDSKCSQWKAYCSNHAYVKKHCKKTCNKC